MSNPEPYFMPTPCKHCPFRRDVKPFLRPKRGEELAYHAQNPYNSFTCHKTLEIDEKHDAEGMIITDKSKECAGFMTLQVNEGAPIPEGFIPAPEIIYSDIYEMIDAYNNQ